MEVLSNGQAARICEDTPVIGHFPSEGFLVLSTALGRTLLY